MWQQLIIAAAVLYAGGYVVWTFLSMRLRQKLLDALAARGVLKRYAAMHRARLALPGCSNCSAAGDHVSAPQNKAQ
jgi:hypothetical protein